MLCAETHLMGEIAAFIKYVTRLDADAVLETKHSLDFWQKITLGVFAQ